MDYRKILVTDGMSNDLLLFMTDAPMEKKEMARCIGWDRDFDLSMDL